MEAKKIIIKYFIIWRLLLFFPLIFGAYLLPERIGFRFEDFFSTSDLFLKSFIFPWANFDGVRYISIAVNGYITEAAFFPLYPFLLKMGVSVNATLFIGVVLSSALFLFGLLLFYKLLRLDYSRVLANKSLLAVLVFPTAFYLVSVYSESLFFLLLVLSFYFARKGKWLKASLVGVLLSITRLVGIFILPALLVEYLLQNRNTNKKFEVLYLLLTPLGLFLYSLFNYLKWGDWLHFIKAHGELGNSRSVDSVVLFPQTVFRYIKILTTLSNTQFEWWIALLEVSVFFFGGFMLYLAYKNRVRVSYIVFSLFAFLLPSLSGTFSGLPRYTLLSFTMFIVLAQVKSVYLFRVYVVIGITLQFLLLMLFSRGYFIA